MDKARHPHVVRTWTVERTKVPIRPPQASRIRQNPRLDVMRGPEKRLRTPAAPPKKDE